MNRGHPIGAEAPVGTRLCVAKSSVLYFQRKAH